MQDRKLPTGSEMNVEFCVQLVKATDTRHALVTSAQLSAIQAVLDGRAVTS